MGLKIGIGGGKAGGASSAEKVSYDNTTSGLTATNAQAAIDEIAANLGGYSLLVVTQEQYDAIATKTETTLYFIQ